MIASLPMYARPELAAAHDRYWSLIRDQLRETELRAPELLTQTADEFAVWNDPGLVLSQTCGMPYRLWLHDRVALVGTPDFGVEGCAPGYYRSAFVVRSGDVGLDLAAFIDSTFAYNQAFSQSGYAAAYAHLVSRGLWFENRLRTGQHLESARAVAEGRADIASLDAVSLRLIQRYEPFADRLGVLEWTTQTPGLPYITATTNRSLTILSAIKAAVIALDQTDRDTLGIRSIVSITKHEYLAVQNPPERLIGDSLT